MKHLVETNLTDTLSRDFGEIYTEEVKKGILDFAHGIDGATEKTEQDYVLEKFKAARRELPDEITVLPPFDVFSYIENGYRKIHVDASAKNGGTGEEKSPFNTIGEALSSVRAGEKTALMIHAGTYVEGKTLEIVRKYTGTPDAPFIITSAGDGEVSISAAKSLSYADFSPVEPDDEIAARLPKEAKSKVLFADVKKLGWSQEEIGASNLQSHPVLYIDGQKMDLARFPNNTGNQYDLLFFKKVEEMGSSIAAGGSVLYAHWIERVRYYLDRKAYENGKGEKASWERVYKEYGKEKPLYASKEEADRDYEKLALREKEGFAPYIDNHGNYNIDLGYTVRLTPNYQENADRHITEEEIAALSEWKSVRDRNVLIFGNAYAGWDYNHYLVRSIDKADGGYTLTTQNGSRYGAMQCGNSPTGHNMFYIYNAIEALDMAGEWYMDEVTGRLYIYPTENFECARVEYAAKEYDLMSVNTDNVIINGIHFDKGSTKAIIADYCEGLVVQNSVFTNIGQNAVYLRQCTHSAIIYNKFKYNRANSISLTGYDLLCRGIAGCNVIQNNHIDHPIGTQAGILIGGWRNCVSHNTLDLSQIVIADAAAFENIVEYNDVRGGHTDTSDAGLIYVNQFASRATHIRYNYLHNWHAPGNGVYLDDMNSGNYVYCNVIDTTDAKGRKPRGFVYTSSGHDHVIYNNFCVGRRHIIENSIVKEGEKYVTVGYKTRPGVIEAEIGEVTEDGKYMLTVRVGEDTYTAPAEKTQWVDCSEYCARVPHEGHRELVLKCIKSLSDTEGDRVSANFENLDGTFTAYSSYYDKINQSWLYFSDRCHLGYRVPAMLENYFKNYYFTDTQPIFRNGFPELYTYLDMYKKFARERKEEGYRINPLEIFLRSPAMNIMDNNVTLGVPHTMEDGPIAGTAKGVDAYGNEKEYYERNTNTLRGNYDATCESYEGISAMIDEYQDKSKPCAFDFRTIMQKAEALQKKENPEYQSLEFVLDKAGIVK